MIKILTVSCILNFEIRVATNTLGGTNICTAVETSGAE